jgi:tripartite-type tricarboxylate transporter receptor subunit TctC
MRMPWPMAAVAALGLLGLTQPAPAQEQLEKVDGFPERPLTIVVPYGAGGGSDQLSRAMGSALEPIVGTGVQVVNKPGGGGMAAIPDFMTAPPDGYTVLESIDDAVSNYVSGKLQEHPADDWTPICMAQITFNQVYIRPDEDRFSDFESLVAYAKEHPGEVTIANVGNVASMERVNMHKLEQALGFETNQIAFDEPSERYAALIGGHVDALFEQPGDVRSFLDAGDMKPVLTLLDERPEVFSEVPALGDLEEVDFEPLLRFRGFWTRPDVPEERIAYLEEACELAFQSDSFQTFNKQKYMDLIDSYRDTEGSRELINNTIATYEDVYKEMGVIE